MSKISDNQDIKKLLEEADDLALINNYLGVFNLGLEEQIREITKEVKVQVTLPDRFNDTFAKHGWIATEDMSVSLMENSLAINQKADIEAAEKYICSQFDDDYFKLYSHRMKAVWVWKHTSRERLLNLAYEDHKHGRYHASIPVVLAQIDGLAFDTNKESFFSYKSALVIKDGVAAHETGLKALSNKTNKPRSNCVMRNPNLGDFCLNLPRLHVANHGIEHDQ